MLEASVRFRQGEGKFYCPSKGRRHQNEQNHRNENSSGWKDGAFRVRRDAGMADMERPLVDVSMDDASRASDTTAALPMSNLERFLESVTPSVPAQYLSKTTMRELNACNAEFWPYFALLDLWESFKESSAYGAGVPLVLNKRDSVKQYYVPYLSGIQLYGESSRPPFVQRRPGEESDVDCYAGSDWSSDYELERSTKSSNESNQSHATNALMLGLDSLSVRDKHAGSLESFSSNDSEAGNSPGHLIFEFFERDVPYSRVPLADKIAQLARHCPELKTMRSCDLSSASWISVAWYPIYRIPTGQTLRDLDACFLTFHSLSTPLGDAGGSPSPIITHPRGTTSVQEISLPVFGLVSYKLKGSIWTPNGGCKRQLAQSLQKAAEKWLRLRCADHPDYKFFAQRGAFHR